MRTTTKATAGLDQDRTRLLCRSRYCHHPSPPGQLPQHFAIGSALNNKAVVCMRTGIAKTPRRGPLVIGELSQSPGARERRRLLHQARAPLCCKGRAGLRGGHFAQTRWLAQLLESRGKENGTGLGNPPRPAKRSLKTLRSRLLIRPARPHLAAVRRGAGGCDGQGIPTVVVVVCLSTAGAAATVVVVVEDVSDGVATSGVVPLSLV